MTGPTYRVGYRLLGPGSANEALLLEGVRGSCYFYINGTLHRALSPEEVERYLAAFVAAGVIAWRRDDEDRYTLDELRARFPWVGISARESVR